jgi:hypothetical protein
LCNEGPNNRSNHHFAELHLKEPHQRSSPSRLGADLTTVEHEFLCKITASSNTTRPGSKQVRNRLDGLDLAYIDGLSPGGAHRASSRGHVNRSVTRWKRKNGGGGGADEGSPRRPPERRYQIWRTETTRRRRTPAGPGAGQKETRGPTRLARAIKRFPP